MHTRRKFIENSAFTAAAVALLPGCRQGPLVHDSGIAIPEALHEHVSWIEATPLDQIIRRAASALHGGLTLEGLGAALLVACSRQLPLRPLGHRLHPLWVVAPSFELADVVSERERTLAVLHALWLFKVEQHEARADFRPTPARLGEAPAVEGAGERLALAIAAFDDEVAQQNVGVLARQGRLAAAKETVLHFGCRSLGGIGHAPIHTMQGWRALERFPGLVAEPLARALVYGLLGENQPETTASFTANLRRASALSRLDHDGAADPDASLALLPALRSQDENAVCQALHAALDGGLSARSAWDAILLAAADLSLQYSAHGRAIFAAFHAVTAAHALHWIYANTTDEVVRQVALLQGAAVVASNRRDADRRAGGQRFDFVVGQLAVQPGASIDAILHRAETDRHGAAAMLVNRLSAEPQAAVELTAALRALCLRAASDDHHIKLPQAVIGEAQQMHSALAPWLWAAALSWGNTAKTADWSGLKEARAV